MLMPRLVLVLSVSLLSSVLSFHPEIAHGQPAKKELPLSPCDESPLLPKPRREIKRFTGPLLVERINAYIAEHGHMPTHATHAETLLQRSFVHAIRTGDFTLHALDPAALLAIRGERFYRESFLQFVEELTPLRRPFSRDILHRINFWRALGDDPLPRSPADDLASLVRAQSRRWFAKRDEMVADRVNAFVREQARLPDRVGEPGLHEVVKRIVARQDPVILAFSPLAIELVKSTPAYRAEYHRFLGHWCRRPEKAVALRYRAAVWRALGEPVP